MPGSPPPFERRFRDLDAAVDEVHALFAAWAGDGTFADVLDEAELYVMQLAVHEWVANLVQHAAFGERRPEIVFGVRAEAGGLRCTVEDNSDGFDLHDQLDRQEQRVSAPELSERGRGLLMMIGCTEDLLYERTPDGRQRLAFSIRPPVALGGVVPLFPDASHGYPEGCPDGLADAFPDDFQTQFPDGFANGDGLSDVPERAS